MTEPYRSQRRVEFRDTDAAGIAHFSVFFNYMEEVEHEFLRSRGLSVVVHDAEGVLSWPRVAANCDYQGAVRFEDVLDVELNVDRVGKKSVTYRFVFRQGEQQVAEGRLTAVCCRMGRGVPRPVPIPDEIAVRLSST
ncbi:MAG TPA: thioesterase family protein [Pirellulales bacterium]|jgi:4-hydroxybenzoyl-CoA thioesterase/acyl-CoA thioester hydrolase|nr:thioesterase family protein [Pirellulales bacterium]